MGATTTLAATGSSGGGGVLFLELIFLVLAIVGVWRIFTKAGEAGWKAIIPIYNYYVMCKIVGRPGWWCILFLIPLVNIVALAVISNDLSKAFGHGVGYALGLFFLPFIFLPILGLGSSQYVRGGATLAGGGGSGYGYTGGYTPPAGYGQAPWGAPPASPPATYTPGSTMPPVIPPATPPAAAMPANWYADPSGRHQLRYWDGSTWTEHVSDNGSQATDPL